jgi:hypothetical protein
MPPPSRKILKSSPLKAWKCTQIFGGAPEFGTISFHFVGTDNDKIKIVGGNITGKKLFMWENIIVNIKFFGNQ